MANKKHFQKLLSILVCLVLTAAIALTGTGCQNANIPNDETPDTQASADVQTVSFTLTVIDADGNEESFVIDTTEETVGAALLQKGLIEGEEGQYGLYVKTVNGLTADYDKDGTYWAFYINGEYASTGVDSTQIKAGETYTLKVEKG